MNRPLEGKVVLVTGGTGSLGQTLTRGLITGQMGRPKKIIIFSRDEAKQFYLKSSWQQKRLSTGDSLYEALLDVVEFRIGDVRNYEALSAVVKTSDVIFHAAAMKQVPTCEYFPYEAVQTNIAGAHNMTQAVRESGSRAELVVAVSTDKACKPVNAMGMTKALQERITIASNLDLPQTRLLCVRYGNVVSSRGSVIPLFKEQIQRGGPVTITLPEMTRFLLTLERAVETIFAAVREGRRGEIYIPRVPSARVIDIARTLIGDRDMEIRTLGIRPGEKIHEILVSEEESHRTVERGGYYVIQPYLAELAPLVVRERVLEGEFSSEQTVVKPDQVNRLIEGGDFVDYGLGFVTGQTSS